MLMHVTEKICLNIYKISPTIFISTDIVVIRMFWEFFQVVKEKKTYKIGQGNHALSWNKFNTNLILSFARYKYCISLHLNNKLKNTKVKRIININMNSLISNNKYEID